MSRRIVLAAFALLLAVPLSLQGQDMIRVDRSTNAADPDDVPEVTVADISGGFQVNTGPAAVLWNSDDTAEGNFTLSGTFTLLEPSGHPNYYGLMLGGRALNEDNQSYLYFLVAQNGTFIFKHRANNETVHDIVGRTAHDAIMQPDDDGQSVNELEVRIGADNIDLVVNGTVVHTEANSGMAARTDGIWGVRINHVIPGVAVTGLGVSN